MSGSTGTVDDFSSFPQLRIVAITTRAGRAILGAIAGSSGAGEQTLLKRLVRRHPAAGTIAGVKATIAGQRAVLEKLRSMVANLTLASAVLARDGGGDTPAAGRERVGRRQRRPRTSRLRAGKRLQRTRSSPPPGGLRAGRQLRLPAVTARCSSGR